jgi:hypothetical protein
LFVAFVDISNAFPSTDHPTLWLKLHHMGVSGKLFDWMRMLYRKMTYVVRSGNMFSPEFKSLMGVLIGDPASPILWDLYLSDFALAEHTDDMFLGDVAISHLEHADDMAIISTSATGLQAHLNTFFSWCTYNFMFVNALKSVIMLFGCLPWDLPGFWLGDASVRVVQEHTYVGVSMQSTSRNIFLPHYEKKATVACQCGHAILAVESLLSTLPPKEGWILYMAQVDPHLVSGCEVALDSDLVALKELCDVQHKFLHRLLGVNASSPLAPLFTELGILPLRFRRVILALRFLKYLMSLPDTHLAHVALSDSMANRDGSWILHGSCITFLHRLFFQHPHV